MTTVKDTKPTVEEMNRVIGRLCVIYKLINNASGNFYIGSTIRFDKRKSAHFSKLRRKEHHSRPLQRAYDKYGERAFEFIILEMFPYVDIDHRLSREQYHIDTLRPKYNVCVIAGSQLGAKRTQDFRDKMSKIHKGRPAKNKGKKLTKDVKDRIRLIRLGKDNYYKGRKRTEQEIEQMRQRQMRPVIATSISGDFIGEFPSISDAAKQTTRSKGGIFNCCSGKTKHCKKIVFNYKSSIATINPHLT